MPDNNNVFKPLSDLVYYSKINAEGLNDLNTAIDALYAIDVGALSAHTLNTPTYVDEVIERLGIDAATWAGKLEMMRSLLYGDELNWDWIQRQLAAMPERSKDGGTDNAAD